MDIFTLDKETYESSSFIPKIHSALWVERYNEPSEFRITGDLSTMKELLPIGSFVTHRNTLQVMEVEEYIIDETIENPNDIIVAGHDVASIVMQNRVVTRTDDVSTWVDFETIDPSPYSHYSLDPMTYSFTVTNAHACVYDLLNHFLINSPFGDIENLPNFALIDELESYYDLYGLPRIIKKLPLLSDAVYQIMNAADIGLRIERPTSIHPTSLAFIIHAGNNTTVRFGRHSNGLSEGRHLASLKDYKNGFYVNLGDYTIVNHDRIATGWDTKLLPVDANDWVPDSGTFPDPSDTRYQLVARGQEEINRHKRIKIVESSVKKSDNYKYQVDYFIGDTVSMDDFYGEDSQMRVFEYAFFSDKTGDGAILTLAPVTAQMALGD